MTKRRACAITIVLCMAMTLAASSAFTEDYRLGIQDRVKIKVQEWPDLSGEYTVSADGSVSLPLIGNIQVVGSHLAVLAQEISKRLQQRSGGTERPFAAVEIAQYRPFSIVGDVQRPGEYPYRPDLTVLEAISIAGGYYRPEVGLLRLDRDMALAKGEIRTLSAKQNRLLAREARLTAALAGRQDIPVPAEFANQGDNPAITAIMEGEKAALSVETDTARSENVAFENIKSLYEREITSLHGQIDALTQEEGTIDQQLKEFRSLSAKGLALMPTLFNLERSVAQIANEKMSLETAIVRAQQNITLAEQQLHERALERNRTDTRDLRQTKDDLTEVRAKLRTAGDLLVEAEVSAPAEARARLAEGGERPAITVLRKDGGTTRETTANETTVVLPDDVIKVPMIHPEPHVANGPFNLTRAENSEKPGDRSQ